MQIKYSIEIRRFQTFFSFSRQYNFSNTQSTIIYKRKCLKSANSIYLKMKLKRISKISLEERPMCIACFMAEIAYIFIIDTRRQCSLPIKRLILNTDFQGRKIY